MPVPSITRRLTNHLQIKVRVGTEHAQQFESTIGIMQGDCLSAILCIYSLARCLDELNTEDDIQPDVFYIAPKCADLPKYCHTSVSPVNCLLFIY